MSVPANGVAACAAVVALLCVALVSGCSGGADEVQPQPAPPSEKAQAAPAAKAAEKSTRPDQVGYSEDEMEALAAKYAQEAIVEITVANMKEKLAQLEKDIEGELEVEIAAVAAADAKSARR